MKYLCVNDYDMAYIEVGKGRPLVCVHGTFNDFRCWSGPVDLWGHSRGGHIAFRVAQQRPELSRKLILAEPGGELDASFC